MSSSFSDPIPLAMVNSVSFFREASPYIRQHQKRIFVIALPGEIMELENLRRIIQDIAIVSALGARIVLVHGSRPQIEARLASRQHPVSFHKGQRISDAEALLAAKESCGFLRIQLENLLSFALSQPGFSRNGLGVSSGNFVTARPIGVIDGIDFGYTGKVRRIHKEQIMAQLELDRIVLLSPLGYSPTGEAYNLPYEQLAVETAQTLAADKLLFIDDTPIELPGAMSLAEAKQNQQRHPLLPQIIDALENQVGRVHLLNARQDGALLLELYTRQGVGSMIATNASESIRPAGIEDISGIMNIIRPLEQAGTLVKRSREQLELEINKFLVNVLDQQVIGCAALYDTGDDEVGELACMAVDPAYRSSNRGENLLKAVIAAARQQQKKRLMVLTTQTTDWFREHGFTAASVDDLPPHKKQLYNYKRNSKVFLLDITP